jgi:hypothetical protein
MPVAALETGPGQDLSPERSFFTPRKGVAVIGALILGIGDDDAFDLGGLLSAVIGVVIVLLVAGFVVNRLGGRRPSTS